MSFDPFAMNDAILGAFGESATVQLPDGSIAALDGVFRAPYVGADLNGQPIERLDTTLEVRSSDWIAVGGEIGSLLTVREHGYTVTDQSTDDGEMTRLVLRDYL